MSMKFKFCEHIFTNLRGETVTIVSLNSPQVFRLQGPLVTCWRNVLAGDDLVSLSQQLGVPTAEMEKLLAHFAALGLVEAPTSNPRLVSELGPCEWPGIGTLTIELVSEELDTVFAAIAGDGSKQDGV